MKRKDQILSVSLALFNDEGEAAVTAMDIANEMEISPGNLYYHFRGKDEILLALFDRFEAAQRHLLQEAVERAAVHDCWLALYVLLEHQYEYRFLFRDAASVQRRHPSLARRFPRILQGQRKLMTRLVRDLGGGCLARRGTNDPVVLAENLVDTLLLILVFSLEFQALQSRDLDRDDVILSTMERIMAALAPYADSSECAFMADCQSRYRDHSRG